MLSITTVPDGVMIGNPDQATVTILDDDRKQYSHIVSSLLMITA